jgi:hypothetical protein
MLKSENVIVYCLVRAITHISERKTEETLRKTQYIHFICGFFNAGLLSNI